MSNQSLTQNLLERLGAVEAIDRFWGVLAPVFRPHLWRKSPVKVDLNALPVSDADLTRLSRQKRRVCAEIPQSACLERRVVIPRAARGRAPQAIAMYLKANMPLGARGLVWRSVFEKEDGTQLVYRCLIVKEAHLKDLTTRAISSGVRLAEVGIREVNTPPLWEAQPQSQRTAQNWAGALALVIVLCALLVIGVTESHVRQLEDLVAARTERIAALRQRSEAARLGNTEATDRNDAVADQIARLDAGSRPLSKISDIAAALPSDVWLSEMSFANDEWHISGFAKSEVTATVVALQALPWAQNVRLDGPVSFDSFSGQNRFDIAMRMVPQGDRK